MTYTFRTFIVPAAVVDMARAPFAAMERLGLQMVRGVLP